MARIILRRGLWVYALLVMGLTVLRMLGIHGVGWLDLANAFAPYAYLMLSVTLPLSVVMTWRDRKPWLMVLQIGLVLVGVYWFVFPIRYTPIAPVADDTFKLITYNMLGHNDDVSDAVDWLLAEAPDVIVLQETGEGYDRRLAGLYAGYVYEAHIEGNVRIFSRYAMVAQDILVVEDYPGHLILRVVLDVDGRQLAVYATHFVLPFHLSDDLAVLSLSDMLGFVLRYDETRRNQQILSTLAQLRDEPLPHIVAGDFNTSDASLIYHELDAQLIDAFRDAGAGAGRTWPVAETVGLPSMIPPLLRIDYVWHSDALRAVSARVGVPLSSDHLPLVVEFAWQG